jgi:hypothetical protein
MNERFGSRIKGWQCADENGQINIPWGIRRMLGVIEVYVLNKQKMQEGRQ